MTVTMSYRGALGAVLPPVSFGENDTRLVLVIVEHQPGRNTVQLTPPDVQ